MLIGLSSCATNDAKLAIVENPPGLSEIPFKAGETVIIYTKSQISISSWDVRMVRMVITDVNTTRIMGEVDYVCCDYENDKEDVVGEVVEVDIDNIAKISHFEEQVQAVDKKTADSGIGAQIKRDAKRFPGEMLSVVLGFWFLTLIF